LFFQPSWKNAKYRGYFVQLFQYQGRKHPMLLRLTALAFIIASLAPASPAAHAAGCASEAPEVICTGEGAVRGVVEGEMLAFKGIPYARPPVEALRWRPTEPALPWEGVRDASQFGPMCPQLVGKEVKGEEDCLTINVWRPSKKPGELLPVMVWLTGGGNHSLSGQGAATFGGVLYNGGKLVSQGVVFVSFNVRLGALGFLAHPALDAERPERISGNYGSLDQIAMLRWLQANIAAFGGDPRRVFLFGTSAGGGNICALMTSPLTRGLIHAVAMQSSVPTGCEIMTLADAEAGTGRTVTAALGCDMALDIAVCLRGKSVAEIIAAVPGTFTVSSRVYGPNMDGYVFPEQPIKLIEQGKSPSMPVIIGNTSEETNLWVANAGTVTDTVSYVREIEKLFGAAARDRILSAYPLSAYPAPSAAFIRLTTDAEFTCQSRRVARAIARAQKLPVYRYFFAHALDNDPQLKAQGASHTVEHPFFFSWQGKYGPSERELAIQGHLVGYWARMARSGNPNGAGDPDWPAATADGDAYIDVGANISAKHGPAEAQCDFWDTITFPRPHL
jgi:para-nitrobenzyl esterase